MLAVVVVAVDKEELMLIWWQESKRGARKVYNELYIRTRIKFLRVTRAILL